MRLRLVLPSVDFSPILQITVLVRQTRQRGARRTHLNLLKSHAVQTSARTSDYAV
jgi:hypothetical protein